MSDGEVHSSYGGSTRKRWGECPGSVALIATVPPRPSGAHANRGTFVHAIGEYCLRQGMRSCAPLAPTNHPWKLGDSSPAIVEPEMVRTVDVYLDAVWAELDASPDGELFVEQSFVLEVASVPHGTVFGRNDAMVYSPSRKRLAVFDLKNGYEPVDAVENEQGMFYGAGAALAESWGLAEVEIFIIQPNAKDAEEKGAVKRWTWSVPALLDFVEDTDRAIAVAERAAAELKTAKNPDAWAKAYLAPGSWCRWCDAASVCPARQQQVVEAGQLQFKDVALVTVQDLPAREEFATFSLERLGKLLDAFDLLEGWADQVRSYAFELANAGTTIPGRKLVDKVARAKWQGSEDEIAAYLSLTYGIAPEQVLPPKLVGITEAEKLLGYQIKDKTALKAAKDDLRFKFTVKESSGVNLVPESHKAPAALPPGANAFATVSLLPSSL
jgi:hypothetical protein